MGKALFGTYATPSSIELLDEVWSLRERVAQLEAALAEAEAARDSAPVLVGDDEPAPATS